MATAVAIICVAAIGFQLLSGRADLARGGRTVFGCFLIFGAPAIASGLLSMIGTNGTRGQIETPAHLDTMPAPIPAASPPQTDPYAGASIMPR